MLLVSSSPAAPGGTGMPSGTWGASGASTPTHGRNIATSRTTAETAAIICPWDNLPVVIAPPTSSCRRARSAWRSPSVTGSTSIRGPWPSSTATSTTWRRCQLSRRLSRPCEALRNPSQSSVMNLGRRQAPPPSAGDSSTAGGASSGRWSSYCTPAGGLDRVGEEHRDRHRANPSGDRRDRSRDLARRLEIHVSDQPLVGAVRADVDHGRPGADHLGADQPRLPGGRDQDLRPATDLAEVGGS